MLFFYTVVKKVEKEVELKELVTLSSVIEGLKEVIITKLKDKFTKPKN